LESYEKPIAAEGLYQYSLFIIICMVEKGTKNCIETSSVTDRPAGCMMLVSVDRFDVFVPMLVNKPH
jgi:hypothetical protein